MGSEPVSAGSSPAERASRRGFLAGLFASPLLLHLPRPPRPRVATSGRWHEASMVRFASGPPFAIENGWNAQMDELAEIITDSLKP